MGGPNLNTFFENFLRKDSLFIEKKALQTNFIPQNLIHREDQSQQIAKIIAPALKQERPSNIFIYGPTGAGKTLTVDYTTLELKKVAQQANIPLSIIYINCKLKRTADTEYRLIAELCRSFGKEVSATGLPTQEVYKFFIKTLEERKTTTVIVLDEIDSLVEKAGDAILYSLIRMNENLTQSQISLIGISNNLSFADNIDPRVRSSLSEEEIVFPAYNALQIQDILRQRSSLAFKEGVVEQGVIEKCAAYAAREHGDARRALELLRVAGELAERNDAQTITTSHLDLAEEKIDKDRFIELVKGQTKQHQAVLYSILSINQKSIVLTGELYTLYKALCARLGLRPLTQRRISDIIAEFDMLGLVTAHTISKGRYGRTREIAIPLTPQLHQKLLETLREELSIKS